MEIIPFVPLHDAALAKRRRHAKAIKAQASFHAGKVQAALRGELEKAREIGQIHNLEAGFPNAAECVNAGLNLTSCWLPMKTMFGRGEVILGIQFELVPSGDAIEDLIWQLRVRVKILSRTTCIGEIGIHWAARLIFAAASPFEDIIAHVPDHRPIRDPSRPGIAPKFREWPTSLSFSSGSALLEHIRTIGSLALRGAVSVKDVGGPVENVTYGDCC